MVRLVTGVFALASLFAPILDIILFIVPDDVLPYLLSFNALLGTMNSLLLNIPALRKVRSKAFRRLMPPSI